eukprot:evm.model.NODE_2580_length_13026_cov_22.657761.2
MVEAVKWDSSNGKEHSSIMDADLEVGDEETTTSTQYSNGRALHSSSSSSVKIDDLKDIHLGESSDSQSMTRSLSSRGVVFEWNILKYKVNRTDAQCKERVATVMEEVDLTKVADQKIGGGDLYTVAGLSGGERKRLNIATEMLADPILLLLDEPTSGLDSVMGELICLLLKTIAVRAPQRIVIAAIHTPSSRLFMLFSHITLLTSKDVAR